ncbi:MAG: hypothetical protein H6710_18555 [Myxococcales bacterium]|nr:hypothetical protein [Myxococcales bacterium]
MLRRRGLALVASMVALVGACAPTSAPAPVVRTVKVVDAGTRVVQVFELAGSPTTGVIKGRCCAAEASPPLRVRVVVNDVDAGGDPARHSPEVDLHGAQRCAVESYGCEGRRGECGVELRCEVLAREGEGPIELELSAVEELEPRGCQAEAERPLALVGDAMVLGPR